MSFAINSLTLYISYSSIDSTHRYPFAEAEEGELPPGSIGVLHPSPAAAADDAA